MRSGKTHCSAGNWGAERKANSRPWERGAGPTHLTCGVREWKHIQTQIAAGLSCPDPPLISVCLYLLLPPCILTFPSFLYLSVLFSPTQINHHVFLILSLTLGPFFLLLLLLIFVFPSSSSSQPRLMSTAMGYFHFISLSCSRTRAFAVRLFCCENTASPERHIIGVSQRFTVTSHLAEDDGAQLYSMAIIC